MAKFISRSDPETAVDRAHPQYQEADSDQIGNKIGGRVGRAENDQWIDDIDADECNMLDGIAERDRKRRFIIQSVDQVCRFFSTLNPTVAQWIQVFASGLECADRLFPVRINLKEIGECGNLEQTANFRAEMAKRQLSADFTR